MTELDQKYLTTEEMAARYRTVPSVIRHWRQTGYGPSGVRVGKRVLYPREQVEAFDRQLCEQSTARADR